MPLRPARSTRLQPMSRAALCGKGSCWVRWLIGVVALGVALQGSVMAMTRASQPAHFHTGVSPSKNVRSSADPTRDPMLEVVRVVQNHHGSAPHQHAVVQHHAHEASTGDVVYLDDDAPAVDAAKNPGGKRAAADLDTPTVTASVANIVPLMCAGDGSPRCAFESHIGNRLERPPR
jgi:hypothetical protein